VGYSDTIDYTGANQAASFTNISFSQATDGGVSVDFTITDPESGTMGVDAYLSKANDTGSSGSYQFGTKKTLSNKSNGSYSISWTVSEAAQFLSAGSSHSVRLHVFNEQGVETTDYSDAIDFSSNDEFEVLESLFARLNTLKEQADSTDDNDELIRLNSLISKLELIVAKYDYLSPAKQVLESQIDPLETEIATLKEQKADIDADIDEVNAQITELDGNILERTNFMALKNIEFEEALSNEINSYSNDPKAVNAVKAEGGGRACGSFFAFCPYDIINDEFGNVLPESFDRTTFWRSDESGYSYEIIVEYFDNPNDLIQNYPATVTGVIYNEYSTELLPFKFSVANYKQKEIATAQFKIRMRERIDRARFASYLTTYRASISSYHQLLQEKNEASCTQVFSSTPVCALIETKEDLVADAISEQVIHRNDYLLNFMQLDDNFRKTTKLLARDVVKHSLNKIDSSGTLEDIIRMEVELLQNFKILLEPEEVFANGIKEGALGYGEVVWAAGNTVVDIAKGDDPVLLKISRIASVLGTKTFQAIGEVPFNIIKGISDESNLTKGVVFLGTIARQETKDILESAEFIEFSSKLNEFKMDVISKQTEFALSHLTEEQQQNLMNFYSNRKESLRDLVTKTSAHYMLLKMEAPETVDPAILELFGWLKVAKLAPDLFGEDLITKNVQINEIKWTGNDQAPIEYLQIKPRSNTTVGFDKVGLNYVYKSDKYGRVLQAKTDKLRLKEGMSQADIDKYCPNPDNMRKKVRKAYGMTGEWDAGHLFADIFCTPLVLHNYVPQTVNLNRGKYRSMESSWQKALSSQAQVTDIQINMTYVDDTNIPSKINVSYKIDGEIFKKEFANEL
jgi:hypothetical protein